MTTGQQPTKIHQRVQETTRSLYHLLDTSEQGNRPLLTQLLSQKIPYQARIHSSRHICSSKQGLLVINIGYSREKPYLWLIKTRSWREPRTCAILNSFLVSPDSKTSKRRPKTRIRLPKTYAKLAPNHERVIQHHQQDGFFIDRLASA